MDMYLYADKRKKTGKQLLDLIEAVIPWQQPTIFRNIEKFAHRLRHPKSETVIAVLLAHSRRDLLDFLSIHNLLSDIRIILILPDQDKETIRLGHSLYPRYLSYTDSNFTDVVVVLNNMLKIAHKNSWI